jgi:hypothetical protein
MGKLGACRVPVVRPAYTPSRRSGYVWSVICDGELLVSRSTTPEFDAARALLAKGITGKLTLLDGKTGRPRLTLDIEKCAEARSGLTALCKKKHADRNRRSECLRPPVKRSS